MKIELKISIYALLIFATPSCHQENGKCAKLIDQLSNNPIQDALRSWRKSERNFLAITGYTEIIPGVTDRKIIKKLGYHSISGTADHFHDKSCMIYQEKAGIYAEKYNQKILNLYFQQ